MVEVLVPCAGCSVVPRCEVVGVPGAALRMPGCSAVGEHGCAASRVCGGAFISPTPIWLSITQWPPGSPANQQRWFYCRMSEGIM